MFQKVAAGMAVALLDGVKGVSNLIQVRPSVSAGQIQADIDEALRRARKSMRSTSGPPSTARLSRSRDMYAPVHGKQEAERAAWAAPGMTRVDNLIVITR